MCKKWRSATTVNLHCHPLWFDLSRRKWCTGFSCFSLSLSLCVEAAGGSGEGAQRETTSVRRNGWVAGDILSLLVLIVHCPVGPCTHSPAASPPTCPFGICTLLVQLSTWNLERKWWFLCMAPLHLPSPVGRLGSQELFQSHKAFPYPESSSSQELGA